MAFILFIISINHRITLLYCSSVFSLVDDGLSFTTLGRNNNDVLIIIYVHDTCLPIFAPTQDVTFQNRHFRITVGIAFCDGLIFLSM